MRTKSKEFIVNEKQKPKETIPEWRKNKKKKKPNFKEIGGRLSTSEQERTTTIYYTE